MDHVILLLGQAINTCAYIRIFNILMSLMRDKKKAEMMLKKNAESFRDNEKNVFGPIFEEVIAK